MLFGANIYCFKKKHFLKYFENCNFQARVFEIDSRIRIRNKFIASEQNIYLLWCCGVSAHLTSHTNQ